MLIATMNPCPCGYFQSNIKECTCSPSAIQRYRQKLSGPLLDRIDITTPVLQEPDSILHHSRTISIKQHTLAQKQIHDAVQQQHLRYHDLTRFNSRLSSLEITRYCHLTKTAKDLLNQASNHYCLSARSYFKIIKVAQTIADLELSPKITTEHISEAIQYRPQILH
jgi:magnesium chelatase family protein